MAENDYFKEALSNFTFDAAGGGAIRHLADLGCAVDEIETQLLYPVSHKKVQKTVWDHFVQKGIILLEEPGKGETPEKTEYVREYDRYGKAAFRRIVIQEGRAAEAVNWKRRSYDEAKDGKLSAFLEGKCGERCSEKAYCTCDFGLQAEGPAGLEGRLQELDRRQRAYVTGLPWPPRVVYHRLDGHMRKILVRLYESGK